MQKFIFILLGSLILTSCATTPPNPFPKDDWKPDPHAGDHGPYPTNYENIVKQWYEVNLKDPASARYVSFSTPRKEHAITNVHQHEAIYGWSTCATVNAKNSYGGYTGAKTRWFLLKDEKIVRSRDTKYGQIYIGRDINCNNGSISKK